MVYLTLLIPIILGIGFISFTRLTGARNLADELWAELSTLLENRHDLVPVFVERANEYATEQPPIFTALGQARTRCMDVGDIPGRIDAEKALAYQLSQFLSLARSMPALRQDHHFIEYMDRLATVEKKLAQTTREYNTAVRTYNALLESGMTGIVAHLMSLRPESPFEAALVTAR